MGVERQIPEDERGHDGLTSAERIKQMTQPVPVQGDLDSYWYNHQIAIVNKRNKELERRIADLAAKVDRLTIERDSSRQASQQFMRQWHKALADNETLKGLLCSVSGGLAMADEAARQGLTCSVQSIVLALMARIDQQLQPKGEQG